MDFNGACFGRDPGPGITKGAAIADCAAWRVSEWREPIWCLLVLLLAALPLFLGFLDAEVYLACFGEEKEHRTKTYKENTDTDGSTPVEKQEQRSFHGSNLLELCDSSPHLLFVARAAAPIVGRRAYSTRHRRIGLGLDLDELRVLLGWDSPLLWGHEIMSCCGLSCSVVGHPAVIYGRPFTRVQSAQTPKGGFDGDAQDNRY